MVWDVVAGWKYPKGSLFSLNFLSSRGPSVLSFKNSLCSCSPSLSSRFSLSLCFSLFSLFLYKTHTDNIYIYTFACMKLLFSVLYPLRLYKYYTRSLYTYFYLLPRLHEKSILKKLWFHPLSTYHGKTSTQI